jgi:hypothetical protein
MRRWVIAVAALVGLGVLLAVAGPALHRGPLKRAQTAWAARPFTAYRATILHAYQLGDFLSSQHRCTMTVEVHAGAAPRLVAGDCPAPLSVEAILARFEPYAAAPMASRSCGYGGCTCALSTLTVERQEGMAHPRRIARDWRDRTVGAEPGWAWLARAPAPLRTAARSFAEQRNPCPSGTGNHTLDVSPIYREEFQILSVEPLR